jgi:hypothetical protein
MNNIKCLQEDSLNLKYLAAQRVLYANAKYTFGLQILFTVVLSVIFSFAKLIPTKSLGVDINPYIALASIIICFADILFFNIYVSKLRRNGAKVQELFDCNLFGLPWNEINSGSKPGKDIIEENASNYVPDLKAPIENWYDIYLNGLSKERAILLCQETNLFYDEKLREHFKRSCVFCCIGIFLISVVIALIIDMRLSNYVTKVLLPVLPIIILTVKIFIENRKSLSASTELRKSVLKLKANSSEPTFFELRQIQDKIYCSRKDSALVPEWYYKWRRDKLEKAMKFNADIR